MGHFPIATKRQAYARADALGCSLVDNQGVSLAVEAPHGCVLTGTGLHYIEKYYSHGEWTKPELWAEMIYEMDMGIEPCPDRPGCETCDE